MCKWLFKTERMNRASAADCLCQLPEPNNVVWKEAQIVYNFE